MSKIITKCRQHGEFSIEAKTYEKFGCPKCYISNKSSNLKKDESESYHWKNIAFTRYTKRDSDKRRYVSDVTRDRQSLVQTKSLTKVINDFRLVHGDEFDYSKVVYIDSTIKIIIICRIHGEFLQTPQYHKNGRKCPNCMREKNKLTNKQVISKFKRIHGDVYDYSQVEFVSHKNKVIIVCDEHGSFLQTPPAHLRGQGCPKCQRKNATKSTELVILEFIEVHGQTYNYNKVNYTNAKTKVLIVCKEHGDFLQTPNTHKNGSGCPKCAHLRNAKSLSNLKKDNSDKVISIFKKVHGNRYDYSATNYHNKKTKLTIICREHGPFLQTRFAHQSGQGCPFCAKKRPKLEHSKIICDFKAVHGTKYDYSKVTYEGVQVPVTIICNLHGEFQQKPTIHKSGSGCPKCTLGRKPTSISKVISKFQNVHGDRYDYSQVHYINSRTKVKIICSIHGIFEQRPSSHQSGSGCPSCSKTKIDF